MAETFIVQVATPNGLGNEAELFKFAYGRDLDPAALAELDQASADEPIYGWRSIARVGAPPLARAIVALIGRGIGSDQDANFQARIVTEGALEAEGPGALDRALRQLAAPEAGYGDALREAAEAVVAAIREPASDA